MTLQTAGQFFRGAWQKVKPLGRNRYIRWAVNLVVLVFCSVYLLNHLPGIAADLRRVQINGWRLVLAWLLNVMVNGLGAYCWVLLLQGFSQKVDWLDGMRSHLNSSVARYIPGYIWQFVGKAYLTSEMGVPARAINILMVWELVQLLGCGAAIALLFTPAALIIEWGLPAWAHTVLVATGCLLLGLVLIGPWIAVKLLSRSLLNGLILRKRFFFLSGLIIVMNWMLNGVCLWLTAAAFGIAGTETVPFHLFTFSVSMVTGILVIPVPNGLGVREGMMTYLLSHLMPQSLALLIAAVSRMEMVTGEFAFLLFAGFMHRIRLLLARNKPPGR